RELPVRPTATARHDAHRPRPHQRGRAPALRVVAPDPPLRPAGAGELVHHAVVPVPVRGKGARGRQAGRRRHPRPAAVRAGREGGRGDAGGARARRLPPLAAPHLPGPRRGHGRRARHEPHAMRGDDGRGNEPGETGHGQDAAGFEDATSGHRGVPPDEVLAHEHALPEHGERDFEPDVGRLHRAIYREPRDPVEGREPTPWWVWATAEAALFWGGWYLGRHGGTFSTATHIAFAERVPPVAAEVEAGQARAEADP